MTRETLVLTKLPPDTTVPMTEIAWRVGWDALMRETGDPPVTPCKNRSLLLGCYIQFLFAIGQGVCPVCLRRLLTERDLWDMTSIHAAMIRLHFDHCIPVLKDTDRPVGGYLVRFYWYFQPMVLEFGREKLSACFVHDACHHRAA